MKTFKYLVALFFMTVAVPLYAQNALDKLVEKMRLVNKSASLVYDYKILLRNDETNIYEDSILGRLYKVKDAYLDSNKYSVTTSDGRYYCKIDYVYKKALVFDINDYMKKIGAAKLEVNPVIDLSDTMIQKFGKYTVKNLPNGNNIIHVVFRNQAVSTEDIEIDSKSMTIIRIKFGYKDRTIDDNDKHYSKIYILSNLKYYTDPGVVKQERFYAINNKKIILAAKYAKYHLNTLTN